MNKICALELLLQLGLLLPFDICVVVAAGLASAIWTLHRGETVMAQMEAARAQQAAEAACIGLTLDEEKIHSLSASTRRHLQGLALVVQVPRAPLPQPPFILA